MSTVIQKASLRNQSTWRAALETLKSERANSRILGGSLTMLVGSGLVSALNFGYNVAVARMLGPAEFGHAAAAVTLLMLVSAITLASQLVCAKFIARNEGPGARSFVYSTLLHRAWLVGVLLGSLLILCSTPTARYLHLPSPTLVVLLAFGVAFYIPLGVKRGGLQGICSFRKLTLNFILEATVRFAGAILLIEAGFGVQGAVGAIAASVVLAYFLPATPSELDQPKEHGVPASFREGIQAIIFFIGQVIINNVDILLVKHFFASSEAGLYAGVALVGRVVYFFSWSVMSAMFPISAQAKAKEENSSVLVVPLLLVLGISVAFAFTVGAFPGIVLKAVFGKDFGVAGQGINSLLMIYAASTGAYSLAVVLMAYEMSRKIANSGWVQLAFSGAIILGICAFHSSLRQVVEVQLVLMVVLFIAAAVPFFRTRTRPTPGVGEIGSTAAVAQIPLAPAVGIRRIRRVPEEEIIAEFLRNEFYHVEFNHDRARFERWVTNPDITKSSENALRRALLFRRRENMWRELPADTEWWEVEIAAEDLNRVRVFPRAQWRRIASGSFLLNDIVERIRAYTGTGRTGSFISKLQALSGRLQIETQRSGVLLIGVDETSPLTIIEGNHRMTAAMLAAPKLALGSFRFFCGFSPHMTECCWYQTNLTNLWRYGRNRLKVLLYDREAEIAGILRHHDPEALNQSYDSAAKTAMSDDDLIKREAS